MVILLLLSRLIEEVNRAHGNCQVLIKVGKEMYLFLSWLSWVHKNRLVELHIQLQLSIEFWSHPSFFVCIYASSSFN